MGLCVYFLDVYFHTNLLILWVHISYSCHSISHLLQLQFELRHYCISQQLPKALKMHLLNRTDKIYPFSCMRDSKCQVVVYIHTPHLCCKLLCLWLIVLLQYDNRPYIKHIEDQDFCSISGKKKIMTVKTM